MANDIKKKDYIDRGELLQAIADGKVRNEMDIIAKVLSLDSLKYPTARWEENIRGNYCKVCSNCSAGFDMGVGFWTDCNRTSDERESYWINDYKYCPECGARMSMMESSDW